MKGILDVNYRASHASPQMLVEKCVPARATGAQLTLERHPARGADKGCRGSNYLRP